MKMKTHAERFLVAHDITQYLETGESDVFVVDGVLDEDSLIEHWNVLHHYFQRDLSTLVTLEDPLAAFARFRLLAENEQVYTPLPFDNILCHVSSRLEAARLSPCATRLSDHDERRAKEECIWAWLQDLYNTWTPRHKQDLLTYLSLHASFVQKQSLVQSSLEQEILEHWWAWCRQDQVIMPCVTDKCVQAHRQSIALRSQKTNAHEWLHHWGRGLTLLNQENRLDSTWWSFYDVVTQLNTAPSINPRGTDPLQTYAPYTCDNDVLEDPTVLLSHKSEWKAFRDAYNHWVDRQNERALLHRHVRDKGQDVERHAFKM